MTAKTSRASAPKPVRAKAKALLGKPGRIPKPKPQVPTETRLETLIRLMRRPEGADLAALAAATGWQKHSVRGAIAGSLKKKLGLTVATRKEADRGTVYRIAPTEAGKPMHLADSVADAAPRAAS
jgi:hypothetical protein